MRLKLKTEGGFASFPGLQGPVEIDTEGLGEEEAAELVRRVRETRFFERPEGPGEPPPGAADLRLHVVTVEEGARSRTVRAYEPVEDPALRALIEALDAQAREIRRARRGRGPGGGPVGRPGGNVPP
ncbi:protealysin inhibitor emfourin [Rubrobacter marinus]|uniref:protealysin inhibitor emfourin n=1 Tax=Rubrobacter marinus TaxID=2653852 RepID=UPI001A9DB1ED|nr:protealysin inhibitor emfourin [Rubrobacter marinus]